MAITFQIMKDEYGSPAFGKLRDGAPDQYAINQADQRSVFRSILPPSGFLLVTDLGVRRVRAEDVSCDDASVRR